MSTLSLEDLESRHALANELHARPFPVLEAPCYAVSIALRHRDPSTASPKESFELLRLLLDRFGAQHPPSQANHYIGKIGRTQIKWERHTEFETYTFFVDILPTVPFFVDETLLPEEWRSAVKAKVVAACIVQIEEMDESDNPTTTMVERTKGHLAPESTCMAHLLDGAAHVATDFRVDENGLTRFQLLIQKGLGARRLGRITQHLIEVETYKSMAMLTLPNARSVSSSLSEIDVELASIVEGFAAKRSADETNLDHLMKISANLEGLVASNDSRFSAAKAYSAIVNQRIEVLRESRFGGRQTMAEFMTRRFEPAMRTCESTAVRLASISTRANRAAQLLRTQADVAREEQNQQILSQMDKRAAQQLHLQKTVEGLSVVAVSYYAVSLAGYLFSPLAIPLGIDKVGLTGLLTLPVVGLVWWTIRRIRKSL